jgi:uncharacterized damage-inducible protein DinB
MKPIMVTEALTALLTRELRCIQREIEAYPSDAQVWQTHPALPNTAGTLALHAAGNLLHFIGAVFGGTGYQRDRDAEFQRYNVARAELLQILQEAVDVVQQVLPGVTGAQLEDWYPLSVAGRRIRSGEFLMHLAVHLGYHLGQIDYHRRMVTGDAKTTGAVSPAELSSAVAVHA